MVENKSTKSQYQESLNAYETPPIDPADKLVLTPSAGKGKSLLVRATKKTISAIASFFSNLIEAFWVIIREIM